MIRECREGTRKNSLLNAGRNCQLVVQPFLFPFQLFLFRSYHTDAVHRHMQIAFHVYHRSPKILNLIIGIQMQIAEDGSCLAGVYLILFGIFLRCRRKLVDRSNQTFAQN